MLSRLREYNVGPSQPPLARKRTTRRTAFVVRHKVEDMIGGELGLGWPGDTPASDLPPVPLTVKEALESRESKEWLEAIYAEIEGLIAQGTWVQVPRPTTANVLKFIFSRKVNAVGLVERWKARLVVQGFRQQPGIDWHEKFSPTAQMSSLRMILALTARLGWDLNMADAVRAFTNADLEEDLYVELPEGVVAEFDGAVGKLQISLYGIVQASRNWNALLVTSLLELGLEQYEADLCVFRWILDGELVLIMLIHVDDMLMASKGFKHALSIVQGLNKKFPVEYLREKGQFMGCHINRDCRLGTVSIDQQVYVKNLAAKCGIRTGCDLPAVATKEFVEEGPVRDGYRAMVGSLMWASIMTRPDISSAVRSLAMKCVNPTVKDWKGAERFIGYLLRTSSRGLTYGDFSFYGNTPRDHVIGYADADYANCVISRFSVSGGVVMLGGACVSWWSKMQKTVALSTTEAEYVSLCDLAKEVMFLQHVQYFLEPTLHEYCVDCLKTKVGQSGWLRRQLQGVGQNV
ncbi:unnamed protein product [Choristocarpus tenellus]